MPPIPIPDAVTMALIGVDPGYPRTGDYIQTASIDLFGINWTPLCSEALPFTGTFDGDGYVFENLTITASGGGSQDGWGLFAANDGTLTDVVILSGTITISGTRYKIGSLAGAHSGLAVGCFSSVVFADCTRQVGGMFGRVEFGGQATNCIAACDMNRVLGSGWDIGGFVGLCDEEGSFENCIASGDLSNMVFNAGGFVGGCYYPTTSISFLNCEASGDVNGASLFCGGGFAGATVNYTDLPIVFDRCSSFGNVVGDGQIGGFLGWAMSASAIDCDSLGNAEGSWGEIGGFIGGVWLDANILTDLEIIRCSAAGNVTSTGIDTGGFIGYIDNGEADVYIEDCEAGIVTTSDDRAGGFIGCIEVKNSGAITILTSNASGDVLVPLRDSVGGFIGHLEDFFGAVDPITILDCAASGAVEGNNYVGGFMGYTYGVIARNIARCYATGNVTGFRRVGGFYGLIDYLGTLSAFNLKAAAQCFAAGDVVCTGSWGGGFVGDALMDDNLIVGAEVGIYDCYGRGNVTVPNAGVGGGFIGLLDQGNIETAYSTGLVSLSGGADESNLGGFCGVMGLAADIFDCFYDSVTSGRSDNDGRGEPKTTDEMQSISTFDTAGWDIVGVA